MRYLPVKLFGRDQLIRRKIRGMLLDASGRPIVGDRWHRVEAIPL